MGKLVIEQIEILNNEILTTAERHKSSGITLLGKVQELETMDGQLKLWQRVEQVGPMVRNVKPGDMILINPTRYGIKKPGREYEENTILDSNGGIKKKGVGDFIVKLPVVMVAGEEKLRIFDSDVDCILKSWREE